MYNAFKLPDDHLNRLYNNDEMEDFDSHINTAVGGNKNAFSSYSVVEGIESFSPEEKAAIDKKMPKVEHHIKQLHDRVFGEGNDRIVIPLDRSKEERIHSGNIHLAGRDSPARQINDSLKRHGYQVHDYVKGYASKIEDADRFKGIPEKTPVTSIGKLMGKLKVVSKHNDLPVPRDSLAHKEAPTLGEMYSSKMGHGEDGGLKPQSLSTHFNADEMRQGHNDDHVVVLSRNKYDVTGMSTHQNWDSCMNHVDGANKHFLPKDIQHGTVTAFLAHKNFDDKGVKPVGRINAKHYVSDDNTHHVFVPEGTSYGVAHPTFKHTVKSFFDTHYPMQEKDYHKHPDLYNDDGKTTIFKRDYTKSNMLESAAGVRRFAEMHINAANKAYEDPKHQHDDWDDHPYTHHLHAGKAGIEEIMGKMPVHHAMKIGMAALAAHEKENNGHTEDPIYGITAGHVKPYDLIGHAFNDKFRQRHVNELSDDELHDVMQQTHKHIAKSFGSFDKDVHSDSMSHHAGILSEARMRLKNNPRIRDTYVDNIKDAPDYHKHLEHDYNSTMFTHHPIMSTTDPRKMHSHLNDTELHSFEGAEHPADMQYHNRHDISKHIGLHADEKLAHHFHDEHSEGMMADSFVHGLNKNPKGEKIQHSMLDKGGAQVHFDLAAHSDKHSVVSRIASMEGQPNHNARQVAIATAKKRLTNGTVQKLEEGFVGKALDHLANSAQDSIQKKFLMHMAHHLKSMLDPDYKFYRGHAKSKEEKSVEKQEAEVQALANLLEQNGVDIKAIYDEMGSEKNDPPQPEDQIFIFNMTQRMQRQKYETEDSVDEAKKKKKAATKSSDGELSKESTPVLINPTKDQI